MMFSGNSRFFINTAFIMYMDKVAILQVLACASSDEAERTSMGYVQRR